MNAKEESARLFRLEKSADVMASTYSIVLYGHDQTEMEAAINAAFDEVRRLDEMLSIYRPANEWSRIIREAAHKAVKVSPEMFQLLARCLEYSRTSQGAFDVSVGALMKTWGFYKGTGRLPRPAEVADALACVGYQHIHLDAAVQTIQFDRPGIEINPGGIGKGYAVDRMVDVLRQKAFDTALVLASSSSIYGMGTPPAEPRGWQIDIRDPRRPRKSAVAVFLRDMSVSTSGGLEQTFWAEGRLYSHIMDPRTGYPAKGMLSVSVIAPRATDSEAWTKPCFINGRQWAARHKPGGFSVFCCEDGPETPYAWS